MANQSEQVSPESSHSQLLAVHADPPSSLLFAELGGEFHMRGRVGCGGRRIDKEEEKKEKTPEVECPQVGTTTTCCKGEESLVRQPSAWL